MSKNTHHLRKLRTMRKRKFGTLVIDRPHWDAWEKVTIKALNTAEVAYINDHSAGGGLSGSAQLYICVFGIQSWTLTDDMGQGIPWPALPITPDGSFDQNIVNARLAALRTLAPDDSTYITGEIGKLNRQESKESQESFLASYVRGSAESPPEPSQEPQLIET